MQRDLAAVAAALAPAEPTAATQAATAPVHSTAARTRRARKSPLPSATAATLLPAPAPATPDVLQCSGRPEERGGLDEVILTTCPRDCYDACGVAVVKRDGR